MLMLMWLCVWACVHMCMFNMLCVRVHISQLIPVHFCVHLFVSVHASVYV